MNDFGERLKIALKEAGYTQARATEELELSKNAITNYVGGRIPDATILYKLSKLIGVSMEWLLTGIESHKEEIEEENASDNSLVLTDTEKDMIAKFQVLDYDDKKEVLCIIDMKYDKHIKKEISLTSSNGGVGGKADTNETA